MIPKLWQGSDPEVKEVNLISRVGVKGSRRAFL